MKEKKWDEVLPKALLADGAVDGKIQVSNAIDFHVKQEVLLKATGENSIILEVKYIPSQTELYLGPKGNIDLRSDVSAYTVAKTATIEASSQKRPAIPEKEYERAVYEEEPVVAKRVIQVDPLGNKYDSNNPFPVDATVSVTPSVINTSAQITKITLSDTGWTLLERSATSLPTGLGPLANRTTIAIENRSGVDIYLQYVDGVTDLTLSIILGNGFRKEADFGPNIKFYARSSSGAVDITYEEAL